jgi:hypothetical protein
MKNAVFWDVTPCGSCKNRRFGATYRLNIQSGKNQRAMNIVSNNNFMLQLLVTGNAVHSSLLLFNQMMEAVR